MVSLLDIVPQTSVVEIGAGDLELRGLGLRQIADLFVRFPELRKLFTEGAPAADIDALMADAPGAIGAIIAMAAGQPEAEQRIVDAMSIEDIADCLIAVRDLTMPNGPRPFYARLERLLGGGGERRSGNGAADTNAPPEPSN